MKYLLDTNLCIEIIRHPQSPLALRFEGVADEEIVISTIVAGELLAGPLRLKRPLSDVEAVRAFLNGVNALSFDMNCARVFAQLSATLIDAGTPVGGLDLAIAATAIHHKLILITHNAGEFSRVPGLQFEDWQSQAGGNR